MFLAASLIEIFLAKYLFNSQPNKQPLTALCDKLTHQHKFMGKICSYILVSNQQNNPEIKKLFINENVFTHGIIPPHSKQKFVGPCACKVTCKHIPKPLGRHLQSFGTPQTFINPCPHRPLVPPKKHVVLWEGGAPDIFWRVLS
jgi:hypothetical protein